jgi:hypothetical protein
VVSAYQNGVVAPGALNPQTLAIDRQNGIRVRPEHIHTALRELAGIADHAFSRRFPLGVADNERLRGFWG